MRPASHTHPPMRYQSPRASLAARGGFREAIARAAGAALLAPALSSADRQLLHDLRRDEGRYQFRAIERLFDLLAKLPSEAPAMELVVDVKTSITCRRPRRHGADAIAAFAAETSAQGMADMAQADYVADPTPEHAARCRSALSRQIVAITDFMDDMTVATPPEMRQ